MDKHPLEDVPEEELKNEIQRRRDERDRAYKAWLVETRPKRARFIRYFSFSQPFPHVMFLVPVLGATVFAAIFTPFARYAVHIATVIAVFLLFLGFVGSFVEIFCQDAYCKMHPDEQQKV